MRKNFLLVPILTVLSCQATLFEDLNRAIARRDENRFIKLFSQHHDALTLEEQTAIQQYAYQVNEVYKIKRTRCTAFSQPLSMGMAFFGGLKLGASLASFAYLDEDDIEDAYWLGPAISCITSLGIFTWISYNMYTQGFFKKHKNARTIYEFLTQH